MSGLSTKFASMEKTVEYVLKKVDGEEGATSTPQRPSSPVVKDEDETVMSHAGPSTSGVSPKSVALFRPRLKGIKSASDMRRAIQRGRVVPPSSFTTPGKVVQREHRTSETIRLL